jgi:phage recombination protein Bet
MSNALAAKPAELNEKQNAIIQVVRNSIFPKGTDAEIALYMYRCETLGIDPLSKMLNPIAYGSGDNRKLSFIVSIDLLRTQSEETEEYAGMDEPDYENEIEQSYTQWIEGAGGNEPVQAVMIVPEIARVKVWRKGFERPFVGIARWKEYYPGDKKGDMWRKMPYHMLAKCAEALARRQAFPKKLNKLYTAEEMQGCITGLLGDASLTPGSASTKPRVNPGAVTEGYMPEGGGRPTDDTPRPTEEQRTKDKLVSEKQGGFLIGLCKKANVDHRVVAKVYNLPSVFFFTWDKRNKFCFEAVKAHIEKDPGFYINHKHAKAVLEPEAAPTGPVLQDSAEFEQDMFAICMDLGFTEDAINKILKEKFGCAKMSDVPAEKQAAVKAHFQALIEIGNS